MCISSTVYSHNSPKNSLLSQMHDRVGVHKELVVITLLLDGGSVLVNDIHDLSRGKLGEHGGDVTSIVSQAALDRLLHRGGDTAGDGRH